MDIDNYQKRLKALMARGVVLGGLLKKKKQKHKTNKTLPKELADYQKRYSHYRSLGYSPTSSRSLSKN